MSLLYLVTVLDRWLASFVEFCAVPATLLFFGIAILLTFRTGWMQFRGFSRFMFLIRQALYKGGIKQVSQEYNTINPFHALSTAMATTIGMGNIVGPSIAIMLGGPGALFWLVIYIFFAASTKFIEVTFALHTRVPTPAGTMVGGPMYYLRSLSNGLSQWYVWVMIFLFMAWSSLQANTLAWVFLEEGIPAWIIGTLLALTVFIVLRGGVERVGLVTARLVPIMFIVYVIFSVAILGTHLSALRDAIVLVYSCIFNSAAPLGGFMGATIYQALQAGIYKGIYISEAGIGSASIPHAVSDIKNPVDQGLLALFSMASDAFLSSLSGLLVLLTGVWTYGPLRNTLVYEAFEYYFPVIGKYVLLLTITLFVVTTIIGNSFNGVQTFRALSSGRWISGYKFATCTAIFIGAFSPVTLMWNFVNVLLTLVAVPNLIGITILAFRQPHVWQLKRD